MTLSGISPLERANIESGSWFKSLSHPLRGDILACAGVRHFNDGQLLAARGTPPNEWRGVAKGAVRISSIALSGKQVALTYIEPGGWFGDISLFDGMERTHDATAHGATTVLVVGKLDFQDLLRRHKELYEALLRLNCRRLRLMFDAVEDLSTKPLAARLAKVVLLYARSHAMQDGADVRIGQQLVQEELAELVGASRQRVNQQLKQFEREGALRIEPTGLVVLSAESLLAAAGARA